MPSDTSSDKLNCSFCGKVQDDVKKLIAGPSVYICNECNIISTGNPKNNTYECKKCNNYSNFTKVYIPYACKLLFQEY